MIKEIKIKTFSRNGYYLCAMLFALVMLFIPSALSELFQLREPGVLYLVFDIMMILGIWFPFRTDAVMGLFVSEITVQFEEGRVIILGLGRKKVMEYSDLVKAELVPYRTELVYITNTESREHRYGYQLKVTTNRKYFEIFTPMEQRTPRFYQAYGIHLGSTRVLSLNFPWWSLPLKEDDLRLDMKVLYDALKTNGQSVARDTDKDKEM